MADLWITVHCGLNVKWTPIASCIGSLGPLLVAMCPQVMEPLESVASLEEAFWEPCSLISDHHTNTCPVGFLGASHLWKRDSHLTRTSSPWDSKGIYKICVPCRFLSLAILLILWAIFSFSLSVTYVIAIISPGNPVFSRIFPPKFQ